LPLGDCVDLLKWQACSQVQYIRWYPFGSWNRIHKNTNSKDILGGAIDSKAFEYKLVDYSALA
jgi:hypothetical protein